MSASARIKVEVVFALRELQRLERVTLSAESILSDALSATGILDDPNFRSEKDLQFGIWGQVVDANQPLRDGDRIEIYRPLQIDPKEARRKLAAGGLTMRGDGKD